MEKPYPEAIKWILSRPDNGDDYIDPVRRDLELAASIKAKLATEEWEWAELDKKLEKTLNPKKLSPAKKIDAVRNLYIYVDYLWMTESQGLNDRQARLSLSKKYRLEESGIHKLLNK